MDAVCSLFFFFFPLFFKVDSYMFLDTSASLKVCLLDCLREKQWSGIFHKIPMRTTCYRDSNGSDVSWRGTGLSNAYQYQYQYLLPSVTPFPNAQLPTAIHPHVFEYIYTQEFFS